MTDSAITQRIKPRVITAESTEELTRQLTELASGSQAAFPSSGGHRIALVAGADDDFQAIASRAIDRLTRRPDRPIHDVTGIYYYPEPMGIAGAVAWMFPGEGAQYLGMLSGVAQHWPKVEANLDACDSFAAEIGGEFRGLRYFIDRWQQAGSREQADQRLRRLDNAMLSVLSAGWCLADVAVELGVPMQAVAGHSAGELTALLVSQSMQSESELPALAAAMNQMEQHSDGGDAELLAVAADARRVAPVIKAALSRHGLEGQAMVAMDNCPHQCVVVGQRAATKIAREVMEAEGLIIESLPLTQPYHTAMFEPLMQPLRDAFANIEFTAPTVPVYSCTTGGRFPDSGDSIRELSLAHWHNTVRFRELTEQMYADGVRVFLEVGPRGNLSSFIGDILRGKPHAIVPMDTPRINTGDQIAHAAAQLAAHHVPVRLDAFDLAPPNPISSPVASSIMSAHLETMQELLAGQSEVMQTYLQAPRGGLPRRRRRTGGRRLPIAPSASADPADLQPQESPLTLPRPELPLVGQPQSFVPETHLVTERILDPATERYATHHTVGGREVSAIEPEQCGLPVMPMTVTLEMMMEAATQLAPSQVVRSIGKVQLSRWLAFYERDPITIRIEATKKETSQDGITTVSVRVFDVGNLEDSFADRPKLAAAGTVELADTFAEAPLATAIDQTDARLPTTDVPTMYNNLFHGPMFQGVRALTRVFARGIESSVEVLPRDELFNDERQPQFLGDPVLLDCTMQPNAAWHLEQPDQTGRIMLPFEVKKFEFFGPRPAEGTQFECRSTLDEESARHFAHSVETFDSAGRVWNRISGVRMWRFYLPFHEVNFHGPKNVYHLTEEMSLSDDQLGASWFDWLDDLAQPTLLRAAAEVSLGNREYEEFMTLSAPHARKVQWMFGRVVAKDAIRRLWHQKHGQRLFMADIETCHEESGRPFALPRKNDHPSETDVPHADSVMPWISIAHEGKNSIAIASFDHQVGIDLQTIEGCEAAITDNALTPSEQQLLDNATTDREATLAAILATKKAVAKATGTGNWQATEVASVELGVRAQVQGFDREIKLKRIEKHIVAWT